jgi:hypothetical protein
VGSESCRRCPNDFQSAQRDWPLAIPTLVPAARPNGSVSGVAFRRVGYRTFAILRKAAKRGKKVGRLENWEYPSITSLAILFWRVVSSSENSLDEDHSGSLELRHVIPSHRTVRTTTDLNIIRSVYWIRSVRLAKKSSINWKNAM